MKRSFLGNFNELIIDIVSYNSICNPIRDKKKNQTSAQRSSDFGNHLYDYRPNWTAHSPTTITYIIWVGSCLNYLIIWTCYPE